MNEQLIDSYLEERDELLDEINSEDYLEYLEWLEKENEKLEKTYNK